MLEEQKPGCTLSHLNSFPRVWFILLVTKFFWNKRFLANLGQLRVHAWTDTIQACNLSQHFILIWRLVGKLIITVPACVMIRKTALGSTLLSQEQESETIVGTGSLKLEKNVIWSVSSLYLCSCAHDSHRFYFLENRKETQYVFLLLWPICLKVQRYVDSVMLFCSPRLYRLVVSLKNSPILVWPLLSTIPPELLLSGCFFFLFIHHFV